MAAEDTPPRFRSSGADGLRGDIDAQRPLVGLSRCVSVDLEVSTKTGRIHSFAGSAPWIPASLSSTRQRVVALIRRWLSWMLLPKARTSSWVTISSNSTCAICKLPILVCACWECRWWTRSGSIHWPSLATRITTSSSTIWRVSSSPGARTIRNKTPRIALEVFADQQKSLLEAPSDLLAAWHWLTGGQHGSGFDLVFRCLRRSAKPSDGEACEAICSRVDGVSCRTPRTPGHGFRRQAWLVACLRVGVAVGVGGQFGYAALGSAPIPRRRKAGAAPA